MARLGRAAGPPLVRLRRTERRHRPAGPRARSSLADRTAPPTRRSPRSVPLRGVSAGFGSRYSAIVEEPFLATAYPGVGVAVVADRLTASLTAGLPFWSFDVLLPTAPTPAVSWSTRLGWLLGAR